MKGLMGVDEPVQLWQNTLVFKVFPLVSVRPIASLWIWGSRVQVPSATLVRDAAGWRRLVPTGRSISTCGDLGVTPPTSRSVPTRAVRRDSAPPVTAPGGAANWQPTSRTPR